MKRVLVCAVLAAMTVLMISCDGTAGRGYRIADGKIVFDEPKAAEGQEDMLAFAAEPLPTVRMGFIGLGMRGADAVDRFTYIDGVDIKAVCDLHAERVEASQQGLLDRGFPAAAGYSGEEGWRELCERDDIDLVYICTPWEHHVPMAVYAMEHGKHVAVEVPAATSVAECWQLVDTSERTRRHCMMLENCIYDFFELTALNMAQQGLFGEIVHVEGAYIHNLDPFWELYDGNWRLEFNRTHRGDVYATHGFGPDCQVLNIHRGDKLDYLVAMDTESVAGAATAKRVMNADKLANGDQTTTLIRTARGKTVLLQHNVCTYRPYDRMYQIVGTDGFAQKYPTPGLSLREDKISGDEADYQNLESHSFVPGTVFGELMERYKHPILRENEAMALKVGGHGGMDYIMDYRLIYCLRHGLPLDQDVYDAAEWSCIGELTAASIENGSMPVAVPDFTRGRWQKLDGLKFAE